MSTINNIERRRRFCDWHPTKFAIPNQKTYFGPMANMCIDCFKKYGDAQPTQTIDTKQKKLDQWRWVIFNPPSSDSKNLLPRNKSF